MSKERLTLEQAREKYNSVRKIFDILIGDRPYSVYSIDGYEHMLGKSNGCPDTWWLDYSVYETTIDNRGVLNEPHVRELIPYIDKGTHRICWEINYRQFNRMKYKWDEWDIRNGGICKMHANGKLVYSFYSREIGYALSRAQSLEVILLEHPFDFLNQEKENGRKIWYYGLPATIKTSSMNPGEIGIIPDYSYMTDKEWWDALEEKKKKVYPKNHELTEDDKWEKEGFEEDRQFSSWINHGDALCDGMIWWFRD